MRDWILSFLIFAFSIIFLNFPQVKAYDDNGSYFTCYNCTDCINALNNNTYNEVRLKANISDYSDTCIANPENFTNKIFDCQGHVIDGEGSGYGIDLEHKQNNTIRNCIITEFYYGIYLNYSSDNLLDNNKIRNITSDGVHVEDSINCNISNNLIENVSDYAIYFNNVNFSRIENNDIFNTAGISIDDSISNTITSNRIINSTYDGIVPSGTQNNTITYNYIENVDQYGIELTGMATGEYVVHNIVKNASRGISLDQQTSNNTVLNNTINNTSTGIYLNLASYNTIDSNNMENVTIGIFLDLDLNIGNNFVLNNKILDYQRGIIVYLGSENNISNNFLYHGGNGIILNSSNNNRLINNLVNWIYWDAGIYLDSSNENVLVNNFVNESEGNGIYLYNSHNNDLTDNNASFNGGSGIRLDNSSNNVLMDNIANSNQGEGGGIWLLNSDGNELVANTVNENVNANGISVEYSDDNKLIGNNANNNSYYGIWISYANNNNLTSNTLKYNQYGIDIDHSNNTFILNNNVSSNTENGMQIEYSNSNTISNNIVNSNGYNGIHLYHSDNNTILNNNINSNNMPGISLEASNSNHIINNTAKDNAEWDFYSDTNSLDNVVINLDVGSTIVSFESKDITLKKASSPGGEPLGNIGKYVNATNTSTDSWLYLNISYSDSELGNVIESTLKMWKYNGSWYQINESGVDTSSNLVYSSNTTEFGIFSPLGQVSSGTSRTGGGGIGGGESINIPSVSSVCGDDKCDLSRENYLTCPNDCKAPEEAPKNVSIDLGDIGSGKNLEGSFAETFKFRVDEQEHVAQIGKITNNSVTLWIWSSPIRVTLNIGETKEFDLDSNGIAELEISLTQIKNGKVFLFFKEKEEAKPTNIPEEEKEVSKEEKTPVTPSEEIKKPSLWPSVGFFIYNLSQNLIPILLLLTILIITTIYFFIHKRKSTKK